MFVAATPQVAEADQCEHTLAFGPDAPFCANRGSGYWVPAVRIDLAMVDSRIALDAGGVGASGLAPGRIDARGGQFRFALGAFGWHVGCDLTLSWFDSRMVEAGVARANGSNAGDSDGRAAESTLFGGHRWSANRVFFGLEAAVGLRNLWIVGAQEHEFGAQAVLDLRGSVGVWVTPFVSATVQVGTSALRDDEQTAMLMLGFSLFPWDGLR